VKGAPFPHFELVWEIVATNSYTTLDQVERDGSIMTLE